MPYLMISFNNMLTNDIVSFEQLGPDVLKGNGYTYQGDNSSQNCFCLPSEKESTQKGNSWDIFFCTRKTSFQTVLVTKVVFLVKVCGKLPIPLRFCRYKTAEDLSRLPRQNSPVFDYLHTD